MGILRGSQVTKLCSCRGRKGGYNNVIQRRLQKVCEIRTQKAAVEIHGNSTKNEGQGNTTMPSGKKKDYAVLGDEVNPRETKERLGQKGAEKTGGEGHGDQDGERRKEQRRIPDLRLFYRLERRERTSVEISETII